MASNSDSMEFEINNQLGIPHTEDDNAPSDPNSVVETQDERARWPTPRPQEVSLHMLMELINETFDKQNEKLDQHKEEMKQQVSEQIAQMRSELREYQQDVYKRQMVTRRRANQRVENYRTSK